MQQQDCWLGRKSGSLSLPFLLPFTGCQYNKGSFLRLMVFKAINGQAPSYLSDLLHPHSATRSLRSSNKGLLHIPRSRLKLKGDRAFAVAAPRLWNQLPPDIRDAPSIYAFKSRLKSQNPSVQPCLPSPLTTWPLHYCLCCAWMSGFMSFICILF